jgi:hypothetical protein
LLQIVFAVAVKAVEVDPAATVTEAAGTGKSVLLLDSATIVPPTGAVLLSVTVQVVFAPEFKLVGVHASELSATGASRLIVAVCDTPFKVAVRVAL